MTLYYVPTKNFTQKTLDAQLDAGTTSAMTLNNVTGVQNKPGVVLLNRVNSSGTEQPAADREFVSYTGVSGSTLTGLTRNADSGSSDQDHAVGTVVEFVPDVLWAQGLTDHILTEHGTDGTHDATKVAMLAGTQTVTGNKTFSGTTTITTADINGGTVDGTTIATSRINPRIVTTTDDATAVIDTDVTDQYQLTAIANATEFTVTGTPVAGQKLIVRIKDAGVAKGLTWTGFTNRGATAPTTTVAGKTHYIGCIYNATASTWDVVAVTVEA